MLYSSRDSECIDNYTRNVKRALHYNLYGILKIDNDPS